MIYIYRDTVRKIARNYHNVEEKERWTEER